MIITLKTDEGDHPCTQPYEYSAHVICEISCECGDARAYSDEENEGFDTVTGRALCVGCGARRGTLEVKIATVFGIEEDRRVLSGRCRVY